MFRPKIVTSPVFSQSFSIPERFWNTKGLTYEDFRFWQETIFRRKNVIFLSPFIQKVFRYQKFSETQKVSATKIFGTVRPQCFDS